jgi:hypothetical protein
MKIKENKKTKINKRKVKTKNEKDNKNHIKNRYK